MKEGDGKYVNVFDDQVTSLAIVAGIVAVILSRLAFLVDSSGSVLKSSHSLAVIQRMLVMSMPARQRSVRWLPVRY